MATSGITGITFPDLRYARAWPVLPASSCPTIPTIHATWRSAAAIFFEDGDYALYRDLLAERAAKAGVAVWAYCLMPNHVHLILVPATEDGLALALGETHRRKSGRTIRRFESDEGASLPKWLLCPEAAPG